MAKPALISQLQSALRRLSSNEIRTVFEKQGIYNPTLYPFVSFIPNTISIAEKGNDSVLTVSARMVGEKNHSENPFNIAPEKIPQLLKAITALREVAQQPSKPMARQYDVVPPETSRPSASPPPVPRPNTPVKSITPLTTSQTKPAPTNYANAPPLEEPTQSRPPIKYERFPPAPAAAQSTSPSTSKPGSNPQYNSVLRVPPPAAQTTAPQAGAPPTAAQQDVRVRAPLPGAQLHSAPKKSHHGNLSDVIPPSPPLPKTGPR